VTARVLVVGGGIGGLATALAFRRSGVPVTVFEAAPQVETEGPGLSLWVNGVLALALLGLSADVGERSRPLEEQEFRSRHDELLLRVRPADIARARGVPPPAQISHRDLLEALAGALEPAGVERGAKVVGFDQDAGGVAVHLGGGRSEEGSLLVAADGLDSEIRRSLFPAVAPRPAGYAYVRALVAPSDFDFGGALIHWTGRGDHCGVFSGESWTYWFGVLVGRQGGGAEDAKSRLLRRVSGFPERVLQMIDSTLEADIEHSEISYLDPLPRWTSGRVVLLGDAAHALSPNGGRGAGEALEDAVTLAQCVSRGALDGDALTSALSEFEALRRPATAEVLRFTRRIGSALCWSNPFTVALRDRLLLRRVLPRVMPKGLGREFDAARSRLAESGRPSGLDSDDPDIREPAQS
jgi:FAD-dependent urate hydroxylase